MYNMLRKALRRVKFASFSSYVASIDQSTTSTKFSVFTTSGNLLAKEVVEHRQICQSEGWLEHDPMEILANVNTAIEKVLQNLKQHQQFDARKLLGLGICNQRETIVCWDKEGKPLSNAIVWCDTRTKNICQDFKQKYGSFKLQTGLPVSPYFSLFKMIWMMENVPDIKEKVSKGEARFGTIDSWLAYNLTGKYVTDASNASRTYLCNLKGEWDDSLLKLVNIKRQSLPTIVDSFSLVQHIKVGALKGVPLLCMLGDQQSSAYAHALAPNELKITYGTGCFLLTNMGSEAHIHDSFLTTILSKHEGVINYGYEAAVECGGGTLNWAKRIGWFKQYSQLSNLQPSTEQLYFYPSFGSILSPYWRTYNSPGLLNLGYNIKKEDILNGVLQSITFRLEDNLKAAELRKANKIYVDGGMTTNQYFMQMQADVFNKTVEVRLLDTCWGVAKGVLTCLNLQPQQMHNQTKLYAPNPLRNKIMAQKYTKWCDLRNKLEKWE